MSQPEYKSVTQFHASVNITHFTETDPGFNCVFK